MKEIPIARLSFFQGYVVTASEDGSIPLSSITVGYPIVGGTYQDNPGLSAADAVAVDRQWFTTFINTMLTNEKLAAERDKEQSARIVELLETLEELRGTYSDLKDHMRTDTEQGDQKDG